VALTSYQVDLNGNGLQENSVVIRDYQGTPVGPPGSFTQGDSGGAHVYTTTLTAPATPDHYLVTARIEDLSSNIFSASDVIIVGGGDVSLTSKYIKTYSDDSYSPASLSWTFTSEDTVYIEVYSGGSDTPTPGQSDVTFSDYSGGESFKKVGELANPDITLSGSYARIEYDLSTDLDVNDLTGSTLNMGYWYGISVDLGTGTTKLIQDWTIQIQITEVTVHSLSVVVGSTEAVPDTVEREGTYMTTISAQFDDTDNPSAATFLVTFKVRDHLANEITVVDRKSNGQNGEYGGSVSVTSSGGGKYSASYNLDPDSSFEIGNYDLYFKVEDGSGEEAEDRYQDNGNELYISSTTSPPSIGRGATVCNPNTVDKIGEHFTTISAQFSDSDSHSTTDFTMLFKIRGPHANEIILVDNRTSGQSGEHGGTLTITSSAQGQYTASYTFDPDGSFPAGRYDLYCSVTDETGNSDTDEYIWNNNGLEITSTAAEPTVTNGATMVSPNVVDKVGEGSVMISTQFEDMDADSISNFTVTFKIMDNEGNEYVLVDAAQHGESGEYRGALTITSTSNPNEFIASYLFNPPYTITNGNYSLYFKVEDELDNFAEDDYVNNQNELQIVGEEEKKDDGVPGYLWILIIMLILLVVVLLLAAAMRKKGPKGEDAYRPSDEMEGAQPPPPGDYTPSGPSQVPPQPGQGPPPPPPVEPMPPSTPPPEPPPIPPSS
jgi:hypothetical protein